MIPLRSLISPVALTRYDEHGEPLYTRPERVLLSLRRHGWVTAIALYDDIDATLDERQLYSAALATLVKKGRVEVRVDHGLREYRLAPVQPPHPERCGCSRHGKCETHAEINRARTRETWRRKTGAVPRGAPKDETMCIECRGPRVEGGKRCERHTEINRERAKASHRRRKAA